MLTPRAIARLPAVHSWTVHSSVTVLSYHPVLSLPPPPSVSPTDIPDHLGPYHCTLSVILSTAFFPNGHGLLTFSLTALSHNPG